MSQSKEKIKRTILITGASGFVGQALCKRLESHESIEVRKVVRKHRPQMDELLRKTAVSERIIVEDIGPDTDWGMALQGIDCVVHLAARVHVVDERHPTAEKEFHRINVEGTKKLAIDAAKAGVRRFVFLSSIKVNGEVNQRDDKGKTLPFRELDEAHPVDAYARSKLCAELELKRIASDTGLEIVIIRPPLVYGPGVKANFLKLLSLASSQLPLPFGNVSNLRSYIYIDNLVDIVSVCITHPKAAGHTYLVSDGQDLSTRELIQNLSQFLGKKAILFPIPISLLKFFAALANKKSTVDKLTGYLVVDTNKCRTELNWSPPICSDLALMRTAIWYHELLRSRK